MSHKRLERRVALLQDELDGLRRVNAALVDQIDAAGWSARHRSAAHKAAVGQLGEVRE